MKSEVIGSELINGSRYDQFLPKHDPVPTDQWEFRKTEKQKEDIINKILDIAMKEQGKLPR